MPVPTINQADFVRIVAVGVAVSETLTASETPTSWAATPLPAGLSINSGGVISGTPTTEAVTVTSATATNGTGTSAAITITWVVNAAAVGGTQDEFDTEIDLDIVTRQISIPGIAGPAPSAVINRSARLLAADGGEEPLMVWRVNDRFNIDLGLIKRGVLQDITLTDIKLKVKSLANDGDAVNLVVDSADITELASGTTQRYQTLVFIDPADFTDLDDFATRDAIKTDYLAEIVAELAVDHRAFSSGPTTSTIASINEGDTKTHSFSIDLDSSTLADADYDVTVKFVAPTDTGLSVTLPIIVNAAWGGAAFTASQTSGDTSGTGTAADVDDWGTTFSITDITGDAAGFDVDLEVVTPAQTINRLEVDLLTMSGTTDGTTVSIGATESIQLRDVGNTLIGAFNVEDGDTAATLKTKIEAAISETVTVTLATDYFYIYFIDATAVDDYYNATYTATADVTAVPDGPSYTNTYFEITVTGREMPEKGQRIRSQVFLIALEQAL